MFYRRLASWFQLSFLAALYVVIITVTSHSSQASCALPLEKLPKPEAYYPIRVGMRFYYLKEYLSLKTKTLAIETIISATQKTDGLLVKKHIEEYSLKEGGLDEKMELELDSERYFLISGDNIILRYGPFGMTGLYLRLPTNGLSFQDGIIYSHCTWTYVGPITLENGTRYEHCFKLDSTSLDGKKNESWYAPEVGLILSGIRSDSTGIRRTLQKVDYLAADALPAQEVRK